MCITLASAGVAQSAHGDESVATSTVMDAATMPLLSPSEIATLQSSPTFASDPASATAVDASSTEATSSPSDTSTNPQSKNTDQIQTYTVKRGDTLSGIASKFSVSVNTIVWANNINPKSGLKSGQSLVILPISGVEYTVKSGDNLPSIAKKFKGDVDEIVAFNNLEDSSHVKAGDIIIIPDGEGSTNKSGANPVVKTAPISSIQPTSSQPVSPTTATNQAGNLIRPMVGGIKTQGIHGHNAVDLANTLNTPILASAGGIVIVAKTGGWNGGYGNYVVIDNHNGVQTLYAHMNSLNTSVGTTVSQGQVIGYMGETGDATGVHVHFEVRGGVNPF